MEVKVTWTEGSESWQEINISTQHTSKDLVTSFSTEYHLNTHRLDFPTEEVHGCAGTDGGNVVGLEVIDNFGQRVQTFLYGEDILVMHGAEVVCCFACCEKIRRVLEAD